jgi:hypothetical protein
VETSPNLLAVSLASSMVLLAAVLHHLLLLEPRQPLASGVTLVRLLTLAPHVITLAPALKNALEVFASKRLT